MKHGNKGVQGCSSVIFKWDENQFDQLLASCKNDEEVDVTLAALEDKDAKILEAGCGLGRVVKYLSDSGYRNVHGIEINEDSVAFLNEKFPELKIISGDVLKLPYEKESFDTVLSYGVIEHFPEGPDAPLRAMYDILKPGGTGVITIPSFNTMRRIAYFFHPLRDYIIDPIKRFFVSLHPKKNPIIRKLLGKKSLPKRAKRNGKELGYYINPQFGDYFEYRFTRRQFEKMCKDAGFEIVKSTPIAHLDGLYQLFGPPLISFKDWKFEVSLFGKVLDKMFRKIPFLHNHMHACIVRKPLTK